GFGMSDLYGKTYGNFCAAVDKYCNPREQGDLIMSHSDGEWLNGLTSNCSASTTDTYASSYDPNGYNYQVEVPSGHPQFDVEVYDPAFVPFWFDPFNKRLTCPNGAPTIDPQIPPPLPAINHYSVTTVFTVTKPDGTSVTKTYAS